MRGTGTAHEHATDFYLDCDGLLGGVHPDGDTPIYDVEAATHNLLLRVRKVRPAPPAGRTCLSGQLVGTGRLPARSPPAAIHRARLVAKGVQSDAHAVFDLARFAGRGCGNPDHHRNHLCDVDVEAHDAQHWGMEIRALMHGGGEQG